jgi:hypothetical protein
LHSPPKAISQNKSGVDCGKQKSGAGAAFWFALRPDAGRGFCGCSRATPCDGGDAAAPRRLPTPNNDPDGGRVLVTLKPLASPRRMWQVSRLQDISIMRDCITTNRLPRLLGRVAGFMCFLALGSDAVAQGGAAPVPAAPSQLRTTGTLLAAAVPAQPQPVAAPVRKPPPPPPANSLADVTGHSFAGEDFRVPALLPGGAQLLSHYGTVSTFLHIEPAARRARMRFKPRPAGESMPIVDVFLEKTCAGKVQRVHILDSYTVSENLDVVKDVAIPAGTYSVVVRFLNCSQGKEARAQLEIHRIAFE